MVDYHWGFDRMAQAERFANSLRDFADKPEVVVLRIQSRDDGIAYLVTDATDLPFATGSFDFATAFMSIMDMSNPAPLCARRRESCGRAVSCNSRSCIRVSSRRIAASCGSPTARHGPSSSDRGRRLFRCHRREDRPLSVREPTGGGTAKDGAVPRSPVELSPNFGDGVKDQAAAWA
jgi:hypothetical protein